MMSTSSTPRTKQRNYPSRSSSTHVDTMGPPGPAGGCLPQNGRAPTWLRACVDKPKARGGSWPRSEPALSAWNLWGQERAIYPWPLILNPHDAATEPPTGHVLVAHQIFAPVWEQPREFWPSLWSACSLLCSRACEASRRGQ